MLSAGRMQAFVTSWLVTVRWIQVSVKSWLLSARRRLLFARSSLLLEVLAAPVFLVKHPLADKDPVADARDSVVDVRDSGADMKVDKRDCKGFRSGHENFRGGHEGGRREGFRAPWKGFHRIHKTACTIVSGVNRNGFLMWILQ